MRDRAPYTASSEILASAADFFFCHQISPQPQLHHRQLCRHVTAVQRATWLLNVHDTLIFAQTQVLLHQAPLGWHILWRLTQLNP